MTGRWSPGGRWEIPVAVGAATAAGALASPLVMAATVGVGLVALAISTPTVALLGWVPVVFFGAVPYVEVVVYGLPVALGALFLLRPAPRRTRIRGIHTSVALVVWLGVSLSWAERPSTGFDVLVAWITSIVTFALVATVAADVGVARRVALMFVTGVTLSVLAGSLGIDIGIGGATEGGRLKGGVDDSNTLAAAIVPAGALLAGLLGGSRRAERWALRGAAIVLVVGLVETQSRGGLIAAGISVLAWMIATRAVRPTSVAVAAVIVVVALMSPAAQRITEGTDTGRRSLWTAAAAMARDHPVTGVGLQNFRTVSTRYADRSDVERYDVLTERPKEVHNTYLQLLAEGGVVGLGLFLLVIGAAIRCAFRANVGRALTSRPDVVLLERGIGVALVGHLVAAIFLTIGSDKPLWILAGLAVGLRRAADDASLTAEAATRDRCTRGEVTVGDQTPVLLGFALSWREPAGSNVKCVDDALWLYLRPELEVSRAVCLGTPRRDLEARLRSIGAEVTVLRVPRRQRFGHRALEDVLVGDETTVVHLAADGCRVLARDETLVLTLRRFVDAGGAVHIAGGHRTASTLARLGVGRAVALLPVERAVDVNAAQVETSARGPVAVLLPEPVTSGEGVELRAAHTSSTRASARHGAVVIREEVSGALPRWIGRTASRAGVDLSDAWTVRPARGYPSQKIVFAARQVATGSPAVIKVTQEPRFNALLQNEARSLGAVEGMSRRFRTPTVLFHATDGGLAVLGESDVSGVRLGPSATEDEQRAGIEALIDLAIASRHEIPAAAAGAALAQLLTLYVETTHPSAAERAFLFTEVARVATANVPFPAVFMHGDTTAFNLFLTVDGAVSAVDFERSEVLGMPLWDLFYFTDAMGSSRTAALRRAGVSDYLRAIDLDRDLVVPLFCTFSMWQAMREVPLRPEAGRRRGRHGRALAELVLAGRHAAEHVAWGS